MTAASFNFKKRAGNYHVWFNLVIPRNKNLKIIQRLSEIPEITQVEAGSNPGEAFAAATSGDGSGTVR